MLKSVNMRKNNLKKYLLSFFQLFSAVVLFFLVFNRELVVVVKDFINMLPVGSNVIESLAIRVYAIVLPLTNSPSLVAFCFIVLQLCLVASTIGVVFLIFLKRIENGLEEDIEPPKYKVSAFNKDYGQMYLEIRRLLN